MPNTKSAKKALRQTKNKTEHNLFWKRRIYTMKKALTKTLQTKDVNADILNDEYKALQKVVDKAAKEKIIHKNKASRIKARFAKKISAHEMASSKAKKQSK